MHKKQNSALTTQTQRRPYTILFIGAGDIALRIQALLPSGIRTIAVTHTREHSTAWSEKCTHQIYANLDDRHTVKRLGGIANIIFYLAPPQKTGQTDKRTQHLISSLQRHTPQHTTLIYISTSGVYGNKNGQLLDETTATAPQTARAIRRVNAEHQLRSACARRHHSPLLAKRSSHLVTRLSILRVPGIYAEDRLPIERIKEQAPVLTPEHDVFTNHIHAHDLARLCLQTLRKGRTNRIYHACDDSTILAGDYFQTVAETFNLPLPPRLTRTELLKQISPLRASFLNESRRLSNQRIKKELKFSLCFPTVQDGLTHIKATQPISTPRENKHKQNTSKGNHELQ